MNLPLGGDGLTIMPMLQDLDFLAARIEQMVTLTRQLQTERAALQARVKSLDDERMQLSSQLQKRDVDLIAMTDSLADQESSLQAAQAKAADVQTQLERELDQYKQRCSAAEQLLAESQQKIQRLSIVSDKARNQIDSILVRLPGPPQE